MLRRILLFVLCSSLTLLAQNAQFQRKVIPVDQTQLQGIDAKGDFNEDGIPDLVNVVTSADTQSTEVLVLESNGSGSYNPTPIHIPVSTFFTHTPIVADVNNDGHLDIIGSDGSNLFVILGDGHGHFGTPITQSLTGNVTAVADFNNDGKKDIALSIADPQTGNSSVKVIFGNGDGTFGPASTNVAGLGEKVYAADFDGDGNMDLVQEAHFDAGQEGQALHFFFAYGDGKGNFTAPVELSSAFLDGLVAAHVDLNKDGRTDIVFNFRSHPGYPQPDIYEMGVVYGSASRTPTVQTFDTNGPRLLSFSPAGDFDNDSDLDIATNAYSIMYRDASGNYGTPTTFFSGTSGEAPFAADLTKDGKTDILIPDLNSNGFVTQFELFTNSSSGAACVIPDAGQMTICDPAAGSTLESPVRLRATAHLNGTPYRFEVWNGTTKLFTARDAASIDTNIDLAPGPYTLTFIARTAAGERIEKQVSFTVSTQGNCQMPTSQSIVVCTPTPGQQVRSPFHVKAFANLSNIYRFELYAAGNKVVTVRNSGNMDATITVPVGIHTLHFVARRADGTQITTDVMVNVLQN